MRPFVAISDARIAFTVAAQKKGYEARKWKTAQDAQDRFSWDGRELTLRPDAFFVHIYRDSTRPYGRLGTAC